MPWYKLRHSEQPMYFEHERPDLEEVEVAKPAAPVKVAAAVKAEAEAEAEGDDEPG